MAFVILNTWSPQAMVPPEHMAFMADWCANLRLNNLEVAFHVSTEPSPWDAWSHARANAAVRGADFLFRVHWNAWGPIGGQGMGIYSAGIRAAISRIPNMMVPPEEADAVKNQLGNVDCVIFDTPTDMVSTYCNPGGRKPFKTPMRKQTEVDADAKEMVVAHAPMTFSRIGIDVTSGIVEASVKSYLRDPSTSRTLVYAPEHW